MGRRVGIVLIAGLTALACRQQPAAPDIAADIAAVFEDGSLAIAEIETFLRSEAQSAEADPSEAWADRYRRASQVLAARQWVLADDPSTETIREELGQDFILLSCNITAEVFANTQQGEEVSSRADREEELRALYDANVALFDQPEKRMVWHIFKRHEDATKTDETAAFLNSLRERLTAGEPFRDLAREHSDSENRTLGGNIGWMELGKLPPPLEKVVFALEPETTSEPILNEHGGLILYVSDIVPAISISFEEARPMLAGRLRETANLETLAELAARAPTDEDDLILEREELLEQFRQPTAEPVIMRVGDAELTLERLKEMAEPYLESGVQLIPVVDRLVELYQGQVDHQRVCRLAEAEGFLDSAAQKAVEQRIRRLALARLVDHRLEARIWSRIDREPDAIRGFYEDNQHLYQSPLQLLVGGLAMNVGSDPEARLLELEQLRGALQTGGMTIEEASARPDVAALEPGWIGPSGLALLEPKIRLYLTKLNGPGFTAPFQQSGTLQLLQVVERREPKPLSFAEVSDQVREDYFARRQQQVFGEVMDELLGEAGFVFNEPGVEAYLEGLGLAAPAEPAS